MNDRLGRALKSASDVDKVWIPLNLHGWVNLLETIVHRYLTPELESRVKAKITSGMHNNASEVVREALQPIQELTIIKTSRMPSENNHHLLEKSALRLAS